MDVRIKVNGPYATLHGIPSPADVLHAALSLLDPNRYYNPAFRQKRWDGRIKFHEGNRFPAGLTSTLVAYLHEIEESAKVTAVGGGKVDVTVKDDCLVGLKLRDYQLEAAQMCMDRARGYMEEPTGSGKTAVLAAVAMHFWVEFGWRSLILTSKKGIAKQTWTAVQKFVGDSIQVGIAGDGLREEGDITVATAQTLIRFKGHRRKKVGRKTRMWVKEQDDLKRLIESADVLFLDECHHTSSDMWWKIAMACPAARRYGLSGTPTVDAVLSDRRLVAATGPCIHRTPAKVLIDRGILAQPKIVMVMADNASSRKFNKLTDTGDAKSEYAAVYKHAFTGSRNHNLAVVRATEWLIKRGRRPIVLCRKRDHFQILAEMLHKRRLRVSAVWGDTPTDDRDEVKRQFAAGEIEGALATTVWDEGEDLGGVDAMVMAEGVKADTNTVQRIGRGMRGDSEDLWVVDFVPTCHKRLMEHSLKRCDAYEERGYQVVVQEHWPSANGLIPDDLLPFESWDAVVAEQHATAV